MKQHKPLRVALNTKKRYNYHFYDELTGVILSLSDPVSRDLNVPLVNRKTGHKIYPDLNGIKKAVSKGNIYIIEGTIDGVENKIPPVPLRKRIDPAIVHKWNMFVHSEQAKNTTNNMNGQTDE